MTQLIPNRFLFDFEFPLAYRERAPRIDGRLGDWDDRYLLPELCRLDGQEPFARVYASWNEQGLHVACRVEGKRQPLRCDPRTFWRGDNLRLCTDMRDTRDIRRASRYCQQFYLLPTGGGRRGAEPVAASTRFQRAREHAPLVQAGRIAVAADVRRDGYALEAHLPAGCLHGYDPDEHPRLGLYYIVEDRDFGQQCLTVGDDLSWYYDPSTWATAVLQR